ncbi:hypothetical protein C5S31_12525 [ANME-1 cluster archaeon GoMg2]|nr:hypothetical protein [ANME-1 cluster archaeon GoMg2]
MSNVYWHYDTTPVTQKYLCVVEAVPQLILTIKISLLLGFKALFVFLFPLFLDCGTASVVKVLFDDLFIITAYFTDTVKGGGILWEKK